MEREFAFVSVGKKKVRDVGRGTYTGCDDAYVATDEGARRAYSDADEL